MQWLVGDVSRNAGGTGGEHGHSRDTIAQVGHWTASSHLGQFSSGAAAWQTQPCLQEPPQAAAPPWGTGPPSWLSTWEENPPSPSSSAQIHPLHFQLGDCLALSGMLKALWLSGTQLLVTWQRSNLFVMPNLYFIFLLVLELLWQEKRKVILPKRLRSELHTCTSLVWVENAYKKILTCYTEAL